MINKNPISSVRQQKPVKKEINQEVLARFQIEPVQAAQGSNRRRLKKLCEVNESEEMIDEDEEQEVEDQFIADEQEEYKQFDVKDDEDLKKEKEAEEKAKEIKKLKGNQQLDKFIQKQTESQKKAKKEEKEKEKEKQQQLQFSMQELMRIKKEKMKRRKSSDDFLVSEKEEKSDEEIDQQELLAKRMAAYQIYNGSKDDEQKLIQKAMELSYTASSKKDEHQDSHEKQAQVPPFISAKKPFADKQPLKHQQKKSAKKVEQKPVRSGPLAGYVICITGDFDHFDKKELEEICEQLGAECPKSMVLRCNLLFQGSYVANDFKRRTNQSVEDTDKTKKAKERGITIISHRRIDDFFLEKTGNTLDHYFKNKKIVPNPLASMLFKPIDTDIIKPQNHQQFRQLKQIKEDKIIKQEPPKQRIQEAKMVKETFSSSFPMREQKMQIEKPKSSKMDTIQTGLLWSDKYKPTKLQDVIDESNQIKSLREWLLCWQDIHIRGNKRQVKESKGWNAAGSINSFAALLSGDPGIGKTTTARLLAKECGYKITEFNASDVRNKSGIDLMETGSYNLGVRKSIEKSLIIMDEVDGMSSGDRGGISAIISMIKTTKVPIICICNDRSSEKIRSLAGHCLDIKFQKPNKAMVVRRLRDILVKEGGFGQDKALEMLVETFQNDMRQILTYLELIFKTVSKKITMGTLNNRSQSSKDATVMINHTEAAKCLLNRPEFSRMKISDRTDTFFVDSDMVPLMVHQNILMSSRKVRFSQNEFHSLVQGVKGMVIGDMLDKTIKKEQEWGLMPSYAFMTCVYAPQKISQSIGFIQFPLWLGKFSSEKKMRRLSKEFKDAISPMAFLNNWKSAKQCYVPLITNEMAYLLKQEKIEQTVQLMEQYNITPAMIGDHLNSLYFSTVSEKYHPLQDIPSATKAKLTKLFNKRHEESKVKQSTKAKSKVEHVKYDPLMEEVQQSVQEDLEEEMEAEDAKPKPKQKNKKK